MKNMKYFIAGLLWYAIAADSRAEIRDEQYILNLKVSTPQYVSAEFGLLMGRYKADSYSATTQGFAVSIEPGLAGTKFHAGVGAHTGGFHGMAAVRLTATYLHMHAEAFDYKKGHDYAGIEFSMGLFIFCGQLGVLQSLEGNDTRLTAGFGIGW